MVFLRISKEQRAELEPGVEQSAKEAMHTNG